MVLTRILLIEDEEHKAIDLEKRLRHRFGDELLLEVVGGVREAVLSATTGTWDLIILDIALPTFAKSGDNASNGGQAQNVGGVEILRALHAADKRTKVLVVTQYPDVILNGKKVRLAQIPKAVAQRYSQNVVGAVLYDYSAADWARLFDRLLEGALEGSIVRRQR